MGDRGESRERTFDRIKDERKQFMWKMSEDGSPEEERICMCPRSTDEASVPEHSELRAERRKIRLRGGQGRLVNLNFILGSMEKPLKGFKQGDDMMRFI